MSLLEKIFGTHSDHELKRIYPIVDRIEATERHWMISFRKHLRQ